MRTSNSTVNHILFNMFLVATVLYHAVHAFHGFRLTTRQVSGATSKPKSTFEPRTRLAARKNNRGRNSRSKKDSDANSFSRRGNAEEGPLKNDIAKKISFSRDDAKPSSSKSNVDSKEGPISPKTQSNSTDTKRSNRRDRKVGKLRNRDSLLPSAGVGFHEKRNRSKRRRRRNDAYSKQETSFSSLLPPPVEVPMKGSKPKSDSISNGLSSWDDFLGSPSPSQRTKEPGKTISGSSRTTKNQRKYRNKSRDSKQESGSPDDDQLPDLADLFPPDISRSLQLDLDKSIDSDDDWMRDLAASSPPPPVLDGVLPVSDLFYRSASTPVELEEPENDDEELPFSAEQSNQLATGNKIKVRRNQYKSPNPSLSRVVKQRRRSKSPKLVRRGMEMLVGGVPINADPPQRCVELMYKKDEGQSVNWNEVIALNSRDFGPMSHAASIGLVSKVEHGLFCEHFVYNTKKWGVCPKDLKAITNDFGSDADSKASAEDVLPSDMDENDQANKGGGSSSTGSIEGSAQGFGTFTGFTSSDGHIGKNHVAENESHLGGELVLTIGIPRDELESADSDAEVPVLERILARGIVASTEISNFRVTFTKLVLTDLDDGTTKISGEFNLVLKNRESMTDIEMERKAHNINVALARAMDDGDMQVAMAAAAKDETAWPETLRDRVIEEFLFDDDDIDGPWEDTENLDIGEDSPSSIANTNDDDVIWVPQESDDGIVWLPQGIENGENDGPFGMPGSVEYSKDDIFLGGGNDGVFWNYSKENKSSSPYKGALGLRLVDAVVARSKERQPRVIAVGDVHGCIDELQELLRKCDYRPGDLVVFLGDLVSKGPDSVSVVQMAREIGAIGVRGNHDFEVIRWLQAIKSGVEPPVVGSEHFHIASCLSTADMKWMYSLPWYISSRELGALFVHAGFVSGIRLSKQNPRLMMNMRSILPDGTVTSKYFNNWPWARLWDGPQTVLFGHDADRGLQQYEHAIGLDTGCVYGGRLTACILPEKRLVSVGARREYFKYRRKHYD